MDIFEKASRLKLEFEYKGVIGVEDLWDLSQDALNSVYKKLKASLLSSSEEGLMTTRSSQDDLTELKMEVVKRVFEVKKEETLQRKLLAEKRQKKERLIELLGKRKDEELMNLPADQLEKMIEELG